ncbi:MAG: hypothetical protein RLN99_18275 [Kiloniellaceae bacterium]
MTDAIGPSVSDVARALMEARQANNRAAATSQPAATGTGRTGHEGDSVTLSDTAQEVLTVRTRDGVELTPIPLDKLKVITPQGQRSEAETAIKQLMADLGIEGDLEFSIEMKDDGSVAVKGAGAHSEEIEAAINADPSLQKLMRNTYMSAKFGYELPAMKDAMDALRDAGDEPIRRDIFAAAHAARDRVAAASFTFTLTQGVLTTSFVDPTGERFGGVAPETASETTEQA